MTDGPHFFKVTERGELSWVAAMLDEGIYGYLPNTGRWHRNRGLEDAYFGLPEDDVRFVSITVAEVPQLMTAAPPVDPSEWQWLLARFENQSHPDVLSSAEVGLSARS